MDVIGTCYLIHFDQPYQHARHYLGWTNDLPERLDRHAKGQGARLLQVVQEAGIGWELARIWEGVTRKYERRLKKRHFGPIGEICPLCRGARP